MRENKYQSALRKRIEALFPDAMIFKNEDTQGIPDLLILNGNRWASLEVKRSKNEKHQPNQDYYVSKMNEMSYSAFIFPENEEEILDELQCALRPFG